MLRCVLSGAVPQRKSAPIDQSNNAHLRLGLWALYAAAVGGGILLDRCLGARLATLLGLGALGVSFCGVQVSPPVPLWSIAGLFVAGNGCSSRALSLLNRTLPLGHVDRAAGFCGSTSPSTSEVSAPTAGSTIQARFGWAGASIPGHPRC